MKRNAERCCLTARTRIAPPQIFEAKFARHCRDPRHVRCSLHTLMNRLSDLVISCGLVFSACATSDTAEDSVTANTDTQSAVANPFITQGGSSTATVVGSLDGEPGLLIEGGTEIGSFAIASYRGSGGATTTVEFTVARE